MTTPSSTSSGAAQRCPQCGEPLPVHAPHGLCPACLLRSANPVSLGGGWGTSGTAAEPPSIEDLQKLLPAFEILELLGRGGMGAVYRARQRRLDRVVAVKVLPSHGDDPEFAARFEREAQALAALNHPNIVTLHDFGEAGGICYFVMEFVEGRSLASLMKRGGVPVEQSLRIVGQICDALEFAHERGVVHRDIKPANILVAQDGIVKIADFGLAKLLRPDADDLFLTRLDQAVGTPLYMAPEQRDDPLEVDHRADIYSLGVVFYELLTGGLPVGRYPVPSRKVQVDIRLDEVVLRALEVEPQHRYQHARDVKSGVEAANRESGEIDRPPALAAKESSRGGLFLAAAAIVAVIAIAIFASRPSETVSASPTTTQTPAMLPGPAGRIVAVGSNVFDELAAVPPDDDIVQVTSGGEGGGHNLALRRAGTVIAWGRNGYGQCDVPEGLRNVAAIAQGHAHSLALTADGRVVAWGRNLAGQTTVPPDLGPVAAIAAAADHSMALTNSGAIVVWGNDLGGQLQAPDMPQPVKAIACSNDHALALLENGELRSWGVGSRAQTVIPEPMPPVRAIACGAYHSVVLLENGSVHGWGGPGGEGLWPPRKGGFVRIAAGGDSTIAIREDGTAQAWGPVAAFLPENLKGVQTASCGHHHALLVQDPQQSPPPLPFLSPTEPLATFGAESEEIFALALSPDDQRLAVAADNRVRLYDLATRRPLAPPLVHSDPIWDVTFSADGQFLVAAANSSELFVCEAAAPDQVRARIPLDRDRGIPASLAVAPNDGRLAVGTSTGLILVYPTPLTAPPTPLVIPAHERAVVDLAFSSDGERLFSASWDQTVRAWSAADGTPEARFRQGHQEVSSLAQQGSRLACGGWDGYVSLWNTESGTLERRIFAHFSTDHHNRRWWLGGHDDAAIQVLLTPDGRHLITGGCDAQVRIWSLETGVKLLQLPGLDRPVRAMARTSDGKRLITSGVGTKLCAWDLAAMLEE